MKTPELCVARIDSYARLRQGWSELAATVPHLPLFLTWDWQDLWWRELDGGELHLLAIRADGELIGIAPLVRENGVWGFAGGAEIADFLDLIARPGHEDAVAEAALDYLEDHPGPVLLRNLRPEAVGATVLVEAARRRGLGPVLEMEDVSPKVELPRTWEEYLHSLSKKDRHELRRKLRRLAAAGEVQYWAVAPDDLTESDLADFARLHRLSAEEKANFMTPAMERFFFAMVREFLPRGWARLYFLSVDGVRAAATILFAYREAFLLYNSGYDLAYAPLSVGLLLKAFCLRDAIEEGRRVFDFLQGSEPYKYHLGAVDMPIYRLRLDLAPGQSTVLRTDNDV